jgi:hypothetical protein
MKYKVCHKEDDFIELEVDIDTNSSEKRRLDEPFLIGGFTDSNCRRYYYWN